MDATIVDGNVLAGMLSEMFETDATMLAGSCGGCGAEALLAEAVVELDDAAAIVRCRSCTHTLLTVLRTPQGMRVVFGALAELRSG
ncbi:hypothetical protein GCM10009775_24350 [Microbacterium aoyamense]|uniref:Uncharacterized protein n=1 Tax=Microbacterium aoyamense TaxID=344166 RepID=A0ABP5B857_9MICO|nr:DUF6510 family protein [Microbacterium aoyamense]